MISERGWHSRGYLPHIDAGTVPQFITFRLADSLPKEVLDHWMEELARLPRPQRNAELESKIEKFLDAGYGSQILKSVVAAKIVQDALIFYHGKNYDLHAWVVMPTHVHLLATPLPGKCLKDLLRLLKSFTARKIHEQLGGSGPLWELDYFDRLVRDASHFERLIKYIEWNPRKAGLCSDPSHWAFSSANERAWQRVLTLDQ